MLAVDLTPAVAAVKLAAMAGLDMTDSQRAELAGMCELGPDERWSRREYSFTAEHRDYALVLTARALAGLFLFGEQRIVWVSAYEQDAHRAFTDMMDVIDGCEPMRGTVTWKTAANGRRGFEVTTASTRQRIYFETWRDRRHHMRWLRSSVDTILLDDVLCDRDTWHELKICTATARRGQIVHALDARRG